MPRSVLQLMSEAGLTWDGTTPWGTPPTVDGPGLYLVSTSCDPSLTVESRGCDLSAERLDDLMTARPEMTVAGQPASINRLASALLAMWPEGESVLYIGLASVSVANRVRQYYGTRLGARGPHAGGWPIKMLADPSRLHLHSAKASDPSTAEQLALRGFMSGVDARARSLVCDPTLPLPFANLELNKGSRKRHGIRGATAPRGSSRSA